MDLLLHNNNQLMKKLTKIEKLYRGYDYGDWESRDYSDYDIQQRMDQDEENLELRRRINSA